MGLFFSSFSNTVVFRLSNPSFSVRTPKLERYTPFAPNPVNWEEVRDLSWFWILLTTGSSDKSPASFEADPLKVFSFNNVLALLTAVTKVCKLVAAEVVSTEPVRFAGVSTPLDVVDASKFTS